MALPVKQQAKYWGIAAAALFVVLYLLGNVILPFVLGAAFAYLLDPLADWLERLGLGRSVAVTIIFVAAVALFVGIVIPAINTVYTQTQSLIDEWPQISERLNQWLEANAPSLMDSTSAVRQRLADMAQRLGNNGGDVVSGLLSYVSGVVGIVVLLVVVPVVTFYLLLDWDRMVASIDALVPREHVDTVRKLARDMDRTLSSFIRGQSLVCLILGTFYAVALMLLGLRFGFVAGAVAGILTFIPYVGAVIGGALSLGLALYQFWGDWGWIAAVGGVFALGQFIEGNILTPKLVGSSVGLHPVWLLFALTVFGTLFGFVGMLVAVPVAAIIGVLVRFAVENYQDSTLYSGGTLPPGAAPVTAAGTVPAATDDAASPPATDGGG